MNRLLQAALMTSVGLFSIAPASGQVTLQFDAAVPSSMTEELKRYGIEFPQDRVKGAVHIQQGADGSLDVRFNKAEDTPEPKPAVRPEGQEPAAQQSPAASALPTSSEPSSGQDRAEAPNLQEPPAQRAAFDGTWIVSMTGGGFVCSRVPSQTLKVQNGTVRGGSGVSVSGEVESDGSLSLALQKSGIRGSASGTLSGEKGSGTWTAPSMGCSGKWTAQRQA